MKLISFSLEDGCEGVGILRPDLGGVIDLTRSFDIMAAAEGECLPAIEDMEDLLAMGLANVEVLKAVEEFVGKHNLFDYVLEKEFTPRAPLARPGAIYALGRNYPAHARESGVAVPEEPVVFGKAPTAVIGPDEPVVYRKWLTRVDPEAEVAAVIGREGANIAEEEALSYVAGYTILNDVTARDLQAADLGKAHPWLRSKGMDTFCPMGPNITLPDEIGQPLELGIELWVNGELRQKDNTRSLTFSVPFLVSWISRYHTLYPGDVISTGTPEGMKPVVPGDVMEVRVDGIGVLRNPVAAEE